MGDIEPQCQAGRLLGAKGELGIPSVTKGFYTDFGLQLSAKGYKFPIFFMRKINEIFYSLQGEGYYTGTPAVFIRFSGCIKKRFVLLALSLVNIMTFILPFGYLPE